MGNRANINVTGGNVSIGTFTQSEGGPVTTTVGNQQLTANVVSRAEMDERYESDKARLAQLSREQQRSTPELQAALTQLSELRAEAQRPDAEVNRGSGILAVAKQHVWAYPIIRDFAGAVWPALATLVGLA